MVNINMIIVDSTVIIDIARKRAGVKVAIEKNKEESFAISAITIEAIYAGLGHSLERKGLDYFTKARDGYEKLLSQYDIFEVSERILRKAGMFRGSCLAKGCVIDPADAIIAMTAELYKVDKILTRNPTHFSDSMVPVEAYSL
jgi:predicted nucleic acid-binding protein